MNKFRALQPMEPGQDAERPVQSGLDGGFRGDVTPRQLPLNFSPELGDIRFERSGIRKDFGWTVIGVAAAGKILALLEHKYIDNFLSFHRLVRIFANVTGNAVLEVWDGSGWVEVDESSEVINEVYLSVVSAMGAVYIADGQQILEWAEEFEKFPQEDDFPAGNQLRLVGDDEIATIDPGIVGISHYEINYDVLFFSSTGQDTDVILEFLHNAVIVGEVLYHAGQFDAFPLYFVDEVFVLDRELALNDTITMRIKEITGGSIITTADLVSVPRVVPDPDLEGDKTSPTVPAIADRYEYFYSIEGTSAEVAWTLTIEFWYINGAGWVKAGEKVHNLGLGDYSITGSVVVEIPGLVDPAAKFGIQGRRNPSGTTTGVFRNGTQVVNWDKEFADFLAHGHNKAVDLDETAGVSYETLGDVISTFEKLDPAPGARFLVPFARRLIALRDGGDSQSLAWSVDGIPFDFVGVGSGQAYLVEARGDAVDDLMGAAVLGSNFLAVFRRRSIWRAFETGIVNPAIGIVSWLENLGTSTPFSIKNVRGGVMFVGHDLMVYYLTQEGPQAVGVPIHQELIETLTSGLELVDSAYDPVFGHYLLGIPEAGAENITKVWAFDVHRFLIKQEIVWTTRPMAVARFGANAASVIEEPSPIFSGSVQEPSPGVYTGYTDFSEFEVGAGLPAGLTVFGGGAPNVPTVFAIADDPTWGRYLSMSGQDTSSWALGYDAFAGITQNGEILTLTWIQSNTANRRVLGGGFGLQGLSQTNLRYTGCNVYKRSSGDFETAGVTKHDTAIGGIGPLIDMEQAEQTGAWVWIRLRREVSLIDPNEDRFRGKAWYGTLVDEPAGWDVDVDEVPPWRAPDVGTTSLGLAMGLVGNADVQRVAFLSFTSDPALAPAPVPE